jgi:hypothetical protein
VTKKARERGNRAKRQAEKVAKRTNTESPSDHVPGMGHGMGMGRGMGGGFGRGMGGGFGDSGTRHDDTEQ